MNDKLRIPTIPELLVLNYLTEQTRPFHTIYERFLKNLKVNVLHGTPRALQTLADELVVRFLLLFVRDHSTIWMHFIDGPITKLFSREEWIAICGRLGSNSHAISIIWLECWLERRFRESLAKVELDGLVTDFEKALSDAKELIITCKVFDEAIREGLKSGNLSKGAIKEFLGSNQDNKTPSACDRCINFIQSFPPQYEKYSADGLVMERNYLSEHGLFAHLHRMDEGILKNFFLRTLEVHAQKLARAFSEGIEDHIGPIFETFYRILGKFKRRFVGGHFEHYLNATLLGERKHALSDREKIVYRNNITCPFCGYDFGKILKGKKSGSIECPSCKASVGVWAFRNDLIPMSELPESFFRDPLDSKRSTHRVTTFTPTIEANLSNLLDRRLGDIPLTEKERELIDNIREADEEKISMSGVLRRIASEQGKSEHTLKEHYKNALKKLKKYVPKK